MNMTGTTGKNLQTIRGVTDEKGAYEIRGLCCPATPDTSTRVFSSSATRKRMPLVASISSHPEPRPTRNYGGRRLRCRWEDDLKPWQVHMLHEADAAAAQLGMHLNIFVTVNYHGTFAGGSAMASSFKKAMKRMVQWFRDRGIQAAYAYVHENPEDDKPNSHILVHVPRRLRHAFEAKVSSWFGALDGGVRVDARNDANRRARGLGTRLNYMTKGADDLTCRRYGGRRAKGGQGPISFKRAGVAECLRFKSEIRSVT